MADPMQQAREFLAVAHEKAGDSLAAEAVRKGWNPVPTVELEAIAAALRAAPDGFVMVPAEPTPEMLMAAGNAVHSATYWTTAWAAMLSARPQGVKDAG